LNPNEMYLMIRFV